MKSFNDISPIFVVGAGRSGTTLLQLMMNAHPSITIQGELHFFEEILDLKKDIPTLTEDRDLAAFFDRLPRLYSLRYLPNLEKQLGVVGRKMRKGRRGYEDFHRYMLEAHASEEGAQRIGEKTPSNVRYMNQLLTMYPNARIVHIIRDPRGVVASMIKAPFTGNDALTNSIKWRMDIEYSQTFRNNHSDNYLELKYEKLTYDAAKELTRVCRFIGEDYNPRMLDFYRTAHSYVKDEPWKKSTSDAVHGSSTDKWKKQLTGSQIYIIEIIAGPLMDKLGYAKCTLPIWVKLVTPFVMIGEIFKYAQYKYTRVLDRRRKDSNTIFGSNRRFYKGFLRLVRGEND